MEIFRVYENNVIRKIEESVSFSLALLGDTTDEIAESLKKYDLFGEQDSTDNCPLSRFLKVSLSEKNSKPLFGLAGEIEVHITFDKVFVFVGNQYYDVALRPPFDRFIKKFDAGMFPWLEQETMEKEN